MKYITFAMCLFFSIEAGAQEFSITQLEKDKRYYSSRQNYFLIFKSDGNLALYTANEIPFWESKTSGLPVSSCIMQGDGNLVLYDGLRPVWDTKTCCYPDNASKLVIQDDGNLVIYVQLCGSWIATWSSMGGKVPEDQLAQEAKQAYDNGTGNSVIMGAGSYQGPAGFLQGMEASTYCGNSPASWVRGSANLDQSTGILNVIVQLETNSQSEGPKGKITAVLKDVNGNVIGNVTTSEIGTGGKIVGSPTVRIFTSKMQIDPSVAKKTCSIYLIAQCTGAMEVSLNASATDSFRMFLTLAQ